MTRQQAYDFCESVCRYAQSKKIGLRMMKTPEGWTWEWQFIGPGRTTAHTQPVALFFACRHLNDAIGITNMGAMA